MRTKLALLFTTSVLLFATATPVFAYDIYINGERQSGDTYETEEVKMMGTLEDPTERTLTVHLIPKNEKIGFESVENIDNTIVMVCDVLPDNSYEGYYMYSIEDTPLADYEDGKLYDTYSLIKRKFFEYDTVPLFSESVREQVMNETIWGMFVHSFNSDEDYNYDLRELDICYFRFVDTPLLEPDTPIASDSNATEDNKESNNNSGGGSSSSSSSSNSRKAIARNQSNVSGSWVKDDNGWWFKKTDGSYPKNEWILYNNIWYFFDDIGYMKTNWIEWNGTKYFLNPDGAMVSNDWTFQDGKWYYFNNTGAMQTNNWIKWKEQWYYLSADGSMAINTVTPDNYYVDLNGIWIN